MPNYLNNTPNSLEQREQSICLIGAGPVGALMSIMLARKGFTVDVFERRPDIRKEAIRAGRSINLVITARGVYALKQLGLDAAILAKAVPVYGRMIHTQDQELIFQAYGKDESEYNNSISRATLNQALLTHAENTGRIKLNFNQKAVGMDFKKQTINFHDEAKKYHWQYRPALVIGSDGSASAIRHSMAKQSHCQSSESLLEHGYKELMIPAGNGGSFQLAKNALHIWPRSPYMLMALPNIDGSFTLTLYLPFEGPGSFSELNTATKVTAFFEQQFPDAVPLIENLTESFFANPTGEMVTVKCNPWHVDGQGLLIGDAAHSIVPFFGQGMNCGFEDCVILSQCLDQENNLPDNLQKQEVSWSKVFNDFTALRKENTDAIADMAIENFIEMRDKTAEPSFHLRKNVERILQAEFPERYIPRYSLVVFSCIPYKIALKAGIIQNEILEELCKDLDEANKVDRKKADYLIATKLDPLLACYSGEPRESSVTLISN